MNVIHAIIGEHRVRFENVSKNLEPFFLRNYAIRAEPSDVKPEIAIRLEEGFGVPFLDYEVNIEQRSNRVIFRRADYLIEANPDFSGARISVYNEFALKHALVNFYSAYIVHHQWGLLLHASCVIDQGRAHLFTGQSGAGKSTAAKLSLPRKLLADEAAIVKITADRLIVFNSPFRSELEATNTEDSCALAGIHILHQALHHERLKLVKSNGFLQLIDKVFYWKYSAAETNKVFGLLRTLADAAPIYELRFQKNSRFWELIT